MKSMANPVRAEEAIADKTSKRSTSNHPYCMPIVPTSATKAAIPTPS
jgi:hypothetical protein